MLRGALVAEGAGFMSANIHASVSGTVTAVDAIVNAQGLSQKAIVIRREGDEWAEGIDRSDAVVRECDLAPAEIVARIREAGIVGMGGATFPTHVKLAVPPGKRVEYLIINGVECEPYLTSDHRVMLERGEELLVGVAILRKALGVDRAWIGIENNKPDAVARLAELAERHAGIENRAPARETIRRRREDSSSRHGGRGRDGAAAARSCLIDLSAVVCNASTALPCTRRAKRKPVERV